MKDWRLTPLAQSSLTEIARWTTDSFGPAQARIYQDEVIARCEAIAAGHAVTYDCSVLAGGVGSHLRFARVGAHFVVFQDLGAEIVIIDFLHSRTDLPRHIAALQAKE